MTTNRTRAEQICEGLCESGDCLRNGNHSQCETADEIEQALDEAVRNANEIGAHAEMDADRRGFKEGTLAGLEMCKSIVRDEAKITGDFYLPNLLASHILERISAKAKELGAK